MFLSPRYNPIFDYLVKQSFNLNNIFMTDNTSIKTEPTKTEPTGTCKHDAKPAETPINKKVPFADQMTEISIQCLYEKILNKIRTNASFGSFTCTYDYVPSSVKDRIIRALESDEHFLVDAKNASNDEYVYLTITWPKKT